MPASFKVRTVPLDGRNGEFEDVLDPDFGESAIGRVAPVDSGKRIVLSNVLLIIISMSDLLSLSDFFCFITFICQYQQFEPFIK